MVKPHYAVAHSRLGKRERQVSQARSLEAKSRNDCGTTANGRILCVHHARPFFFLFFRYLFALRHEEQERLLIRRPITRA